MVEIRGWKRSFKQRETFGWAQNCFANDLVGFPSCKKSKAIYEGMTTTECQGVLGEHMQKDRFTNGRINDACKDICSRMNDHVKMCFWTDG